MRKWARYLSAMTLLVMVLGTAIGWDRWDLLDFQRDDRFRIISGIGIMGLVLFQWGLTLGRVIFQKTGSQWGRWIDWHLRTAVILPFALLLHSSRLGWGLLGALPVALLGAAWFGSFMHGQDKTRQFLPYHVTLSALTLAMALVHTYSVLIFR